MKSARRVAPKMAAAVPTAAPSVKASKLQFAWLIALVCSFAYELPLVELTSMDRVNPRLFDLVSVFGVLFVRPTLSRINGPVGIAPLRIWAYLVVWFACCAVVWSVTMLPYDMGAVSLFYAFKYIFGLYIVFLAVRIPLSDNQKTLIQKTIVLCGAFLTIYCIFEYFGGATERRISGEKVIALAPGTVLGPLGSTYDHISSWSALAMCMALALLRKARARNLWLTVGVALFASWPAAVSGSRAGLFMVIVMFVIAVFRVPILRSRLPVAIILVLLFGATLRTVLPSLDDFQASSRSFERLVKTEEQAQHNDGFNNSLLDRIGIGEDNIQGYTLDMYQWQGWLLPIIGGGFYVVPHTISGNPEYRVGYGIHNAYLFAFEQGGIIAFVLLIIFLSTTIKTLNARQKDGSDADVAFALGASIFLFVLLLRLWVGGPIWLSVNTENFSTFFVLVMVLACKRTRKNGSRIPVGVRSQPFRGAWQQ